MSKEVAHRTIECSNCGAPIDYVEGESVLTCSYCGSATMLAGFDKIVRVEAHYVLPARFERQQILQAIRDWMSKGWLKAADLAEKAVITNMQPIVLPFWVVQANSKTYWSGKNKKTRTVGTGDNRRTETYWEPVSGEFDGSHQWAVFAREDRERFWGIDALNPGSTAVEADWGKFILGGHMGYRRSAGTRLLDEGVEPFDLGKVKGFDVLNGQIPQQRAEQNARDQIIAFSRRQAQAKADRITDCDTVVEIRRVDLVYLPLWQVDYRYKGRSYNLLANAHDGEIVAGQAPVGKWDKVVVLSVIMALLGGIAALIAYIGDVPAAWIGTGAFGAVAVLYALWTALFSKG